MYRFDGQNFDNAFGAFGTNTPNFNQIWTGNNAPACMCDGNNYSVQGRMTYDFGTGGDYRIRIKTDDGHRLSDNGGASWNLRDDWATATRDWTSGVLSYSGTRDFIYAERDNGGDGAMSFNLLKIPTNPTGITSSTGSSTVCGTTISYFNCW
jgi:hypothetical protein